MKKNILLLVFSFWEVISFGQSEATNWYFGYRSGIQFNLANNSVIPLNDGELFTNEGCATISDAFGNLLFYTDGKSVWNKKHLIMPNGNNLYGDSSSTQSAIIVPKPNDPNFYFIFTVDNNIDGENHGLNYSIIDMTLDNGLGAVTTKNINLLQKSTEKISAVIKDCFTKSIWVVSFASQNGNEEVFNTFHSYQINDSGVISTSIKSTFNDISITDARGYLKISPDGTKLACANVTGGLYLYDFDANTGIVSNQQRLNINSTYNKPYGLEFSPNNQLLYVHASNDLSGNDSLEPTNHFSVLIQYNLLDADISSSAVKIDERNLYRGGLQLGPNGKIYRALSATYNEGVPYLGIINNPDNIGISCNYVHNGINVSPNKSAQGLPPFIASFFDTQIDIIKNGQNNANLELCEGDSYMLIADNIPGATYTWSVDNKPLINPNYYHNVTESGIYKVKIDYNKGDCPLEGVAYVTFYETPESIDYNLIQCDDKDADVGLTSFNLYEANEALTHGNKEFITKFFTDVNRTNEIEYPASFRNTSNPQTIYVQIINSLWNCSNTSELTLEVSSTTSNDAQLITCDDDGLEDGFHIFNLTEANQDVLNGLPLGLTINYYETYEDALLEQNSLGTSFINTNPFTQTIYTRVENENNCYGIGELKLTVNKLPNIVVEDKTFYCLNTYPQTITLNAGPLDSPNNYSYVWSTGETTYSIQVNEPGIYKVIVTNSNNCSKERTITVEPSNIASFESIDIVDATQNNMITVLISGKGTYEYALYNSNNILYKPYQSNNVFENVSPGFYTVYVRDVKNNCGSIDKLISVVGFPKFFTPNNDGVNDTWQVYGVSNMFQPNSKIYIFDRFGKLLKQLSPSGIGWDGTFNGEKMPTDDYWFSVTLQDGRIFKSHFSLKN